MKGSRGFLALFVFPIAVVGWVIVPDASAAAISACGGWTQVRAPDVHLLDDVSAASSSDAWAVGWAIEHWDGSAWTVVPNPQPSATLFAVTALSSSDAWAVGSFEGRSLIVHPLVEHWNGSAWSIVKLPGQVGGMYLTRVTGSSSSDVWAVGGIRSGEGTTPVAEHWDGTVWSATATIGGAGQTNVFNDVLESSPNDVWAVGDSATLTLAEHWDG